MSKYIAVVIHGRVTVGVDGPKIHLRVTYIHQREIEWEIKLLNNGSEILEFRKAEKLGNLRNNYVQEQQFHTFLNEAIIISTNIF